MHIAGPTRVSLLDADPDLGRELDAERADAARRLTTPVLQLRRGPFCPDDDVPDASGAFALLVLDGLLVREALVGDHPSAELIGPGDLVRVALEADMDSLLPRTVEWSVITPARVALLSPALISAAAPWPELLAALMDRAARRADRLMVLQAITHFTRVDDRLHALLWYLAERWGRVVPEGVALNLRLPHRTLAGMVGARRPSVTTAFGQLMARGVVERRDDGAWVLRGGPPERRLRPAEEPIAAELRSLPA
ncbi:MAG TPA: helix-turn-helix domain-containing protein [Solirubrobacteraceae bacterium]